MQAMESLEEFETRPGMQHRGQPVLLDVVQEAILRARLARDGRMTVSMSEAEWMSVLSALSNPQHNPPDGVWTFRRTKMGNAAIHPGIFHESRRLLGNDEACVVEIRKMSSAM